MEQQLVEILSKASPLLAGIVIGAIAILKSNGSKTCVFHKDLANDLKEAKNDIKGINNILMKMCGRLGVDISEEK